MIIEIDTDRLNADITGMRDHLDALNRAQEQIYGCLENLRAMWQGPAQSAYYIQTQNDQAALQGLMRNVNNLIGCMEYAKSEYDRCGDEVLDKIASIRLSGAR